MNRATIDITGPIMENMARIDIRDDHDEDSHHIDYADLEEASEYGQQDILQAVLEHAGTVGRGILKAALANGSPVTLEGDAVEHETLRQVMDPAPHP